MRTGVLVLTVLTSKNRGYQVRYGFDRWRPTVVLQPLLSAVLVPISPAMLLPHSRCRRYGHLTHQCAARRSDAAACSAGEVREGAVGPGQCERCPLRHDRRGAGCSGRAARSAVGAISTTCRRSGSITTTRSGRSWMLPVRRDGSMRRPGCWGSEGVRANSRSSTGQAGGKALAWTGWRRPSCRYRVCAQTPRRRVWCVGGVL
jgi:hypothetical protein